MKENTKDNDKKELKKNERIGMIFSISIHVIVLALFLLPSGCNPTGEPIAGLPLPGMEINLGFVEEGSGDIQTASDEEVIESAIEEPQEEVTEEALVTEDKLITSQESPHEINTPETKETPKEKTEAVKEKKTEVVNSKNAYTNPTKSSSDGETTKKGDQGKEHGNPDSRNMYDGKGKDPGKGNGGAGGVSMDLPGWEWDSKPSKIDPTSESGFVLFEFYIDDDGNVIRTKELESRNLAPTEKNFYKKQLQETSFHLKDSRARPAKETRGVFRFEIRTK